MPAWKSNPKSQESNVYHLKLHGPGPHPQRLDAITHWHLNKAADQDQDIAAIHISITVDGSIKTEGLCMEPAHAQAMLAAIPRLIQRLKSAASPAR